MSLAGQTRSEKLVAGRREVESLVDELEGWDRYAGKVRLIRDAHQRHACFKAAYAPRAIGAGATNGQTRRSIQTYVVASFV